MPTRALLTAVHMHDERIGWAVGHDAVILRTGDGGETWRLVHYAPEEERPLLDVWFRDEHTGFAVGAYGYFLATGDGGDTWISRAVSEDDFHLNALAPAGQDRLFIAAEAGGRLPVRRRRRHVARTVPPLTAVRGSGPSRSTRIGCCCSGSGATCSAPRTRGIAGRRWSPEPTRP